MVIRECKNIKKYCLTILFSVFDLCGCLAQLHVKGGPKQDRPFLLHSFDSHDKYPEVF